MHVYKHTSCPYTCRIHTSTDVFSYAYISAHICNVYLKGAHTFKWSRTEELPCLFYCHFLNISVWHFLIFLICSSVFYPHSIFESLYFIQNYSRKKCLLNKCKGCYFTFPTLIKTSHSRSKFFQNSGILYGTQEDIYILVSKFRELLRNWNNSSPLICKGGWKPDHCQFHMCFLLYIPINRCKIKSYYVCVSPCCISPQKSYTYISECVYVYMLTFIHIQW